MSLIKYNIITLFCFFILYIYFKVNKSKKLIKLKPNIILPSKFIVNKKNKNVLVMLSGGLDSTSSLYNLIKETNYNVYVHHVILKDATDRWKDEIQACNKIVNYLKLIRNFDYSESTFELNLNSMDKFGGYRDDDNTTILFIASKIFSVESYKEIDYIVISNLDCELDSKTTNFMNNFIDIMYKSKYNTKKPMLINPNSKFNNNKCHFNKEIIKKLLNLSNTLKLTENQNIKIDYNIFYELICTKKNMFNNLPKYLKNKIVYCRYPKENIKCGKCFNCVLYDEII